MNTNTNTDTETSGQTATRQRRVTIQVDRTKFADLRSVASLRRGLSVEDYCQQAFEERLNADLEELRGYFNQGASPANPDGAAAVDVLGLDDDSFLDS